MALNQRERENNAAIKSAYSGLSAAVATGLVSFPLVLMLNRFHPGFRSTLNTSAKTAIAFMPPLFAFGLVSEQTVTRMANPGSYSGGQENKASFSDLPLRYEVANHIYRNPFQTIILTAIPTVSAIFLFKGDQHLKFSQRVMHTRVLGQASVLCILGTTMLFRSWMDRRGGEFTLEDINH